jgi:OmcA/MtrC family decaheme c-type cytochrome
VTTAASTAPQNYVDVVDATDFARDDYVVVDDGLGTEEYARIALVDGTRLWFSSSLLALVHAAGATVDEVALTTMMPGDDYTLDAGTGTITELAGFPDGTKVIASYTTDFVLPATYPLPLNASPDLGDSSGEWTGKALVDGTYSLSIWTSRSLSLPLHGETNSYKSTADARQTDFLVGDADTIEPYELIASSSACFNCHQELAFHGFGRRGFESCLVCHGTSGSEDRPPYTAANAPATAGVTVSFRTMLHKIHQGEELANASTYTVVGFGSGAYPDNFTAHTYGEIIFPALPGGTENCTKCHGNDAWHEPAERAHPTEQDEPIKRWTAVCGACHDTTDALAHIEVQTSPSGAESCGVCHGPGGEWSVERMHHPY